MGITTVKQRGELKVRREPYWHLLATGQHLGFRKTDDGGHWIARAYDAATRARSYHALGDFRTHPDNERFALASAAAREWLGHIAAGGSVEDIDVRTACKRYVEHLKRKKRPKAAADAEARFARYIDPDPIGGIKLLKLRAAHLEDFRARLEDLTARQPKRGPRCRVKSPAPPPRIRSAATTNRDLVPVRAALNLAHEGGLVPSDTAWLKALKPAESVGGRRTLYIPLKGRRALIEAMPDDIAAFARGLATLPIRPGAMAALCVRDFDSRHGTLHIPSDKAGDPRTIALPDHAITLLRTQAKSKLPAAPLFSRADGKAWDKDTWKRHFTAGAAAAKLPAGVTAYTFRHSVITDLIVVAKLDLMQVARLAGTSVAMIDKHYGHLQQDQARKALEKLAL